LKLEQILERITKPSSQVESPGENTFAVAAFFAEKPDKVPHIGKVKLGNRTLEVPLGARIFERFKPEYIHTRKERTSCPSS